MTKKKYIIANWKMNLDLMSLNIFFNHIKFDEIDLNKKEIIFAPSFVFIEKTLNLVKDYKVSVAAQNLFWESKGAYTGEVSAKQLADIGCQYVILGHSERREIFNETDEMINAKIKVALKHRLKPIVCMGESFEEKEQGLTKKVIEQKLSACLNEISAGDMRNIIIAYEPIWAISTNVNNTGQSDTPESAQVVHKFLRKNLENLYDTVIAVKTPIIYGGSVDSDNVDGFSKMEDIDGVLVGGASKEASSFQKVINNYSI